MALHTIIRLNIVVIVPSQREDGALASEIALDDYHSKATQPGRELKSMVSVLRFYEVGQVSTVHLRFSPTNYRGRPKGRIRRAPLT